MHQEVGREKKLAHFIGWAGVKQLKKCSQETQCDQYTMQNFHEVDKQLPGNGKKVNVVEKS